MNANFTAILEEYVNWLDTLGYGESAIFGCKFRVCDFFQWLENKQITSINLLTNKHIQEYYRYLETRPNKTFKGRLLGNVSLNKNFEAIDKLLNFLHQYGVENVPVPTNHRIKTDKQERIFKIETLTQQEIKTLYNCIPNTYLQYHFKERQVKHYELRLIFALFYGCGLRYSEGYKLQIQDVDFDKKTVFVRQGKGYKDRIVPISAGICNALKDYIYNFRNRFKLNHNRLFICKKPVLKNRIKHLQNTCQDANIRAKRLTMHLFRHSIATHLLQNGMSIENIALFLGHSSLVSTQIYTHLSHCDFRN